VNSQTVIATVTVVNPQGLHLRPADMFVKLAVQFQSQIELVKDELRVDGKSMLDMLRIAAVATAGAELQIEATGADAQMAVDALSELFRQGFGENGNHQT
jgi:phosphotransferase system HPr (HPr) family protein